MQNFPKILRAVLKNCNDGIVIGPFLFEGRGTKMLKNHQLSMTKKNEATEKNKLLNGIKNFQQNKKKKNDDMVVKSTRYSLNKQTNKKNFVEYRKHYYRMLKSIS